MATFSDTGGNLCFLNSVPLRIIDFHLAEQRGLGLDLRAIADNYNLRMRGIKILLKFARDHNPELCKQDCAQLAKVD